MENTDTTGTTLSGDAHMTPSDLGPASGNPSPETLTLEELNTLTGKQFPSKDSALKSIKDTFAAVVKKSDKIIEEVVSSEQISSISKELKSLRTDMFYKDNPEYAEYREIISKLGDDPSETVNSDAFKKIFEKAKGFEGIQNNRTVLESNPRIASVRDNFQKAKESLAGGKKAQAEELIAQAVREKFNF